jgi:hypothetical protein
MVIEATPGDPIRMVLGHIEGGTYSYSQLHKFTGLGWSRLLVCCGKRHVN